MSTSTQWNPFRALERRNDSFEDLVREFFDTTEGDVMPPAC